MSRITISDPEASFFTSLPGAPRPEKLPRTIGGLLRLAHLRRPATQDALLPNQDNYWEGWLKGVERAKVWWDTPEALRPPETWSPSVSRMMPDHLSPGVWADHVTPWGQGILGYRTWCPPGSGELSAYALGFPLAEEELVRAARAASDLMTVPQYVIWAYDLDLDGLPIPESARTTLKRKIRMRELLQESPLLSGSVVLKAAIPKVMHDTANLLALCPRRSEGVGRTGKRSLSSARASRRKKRGY